ncbi:hypothetical protein Cni_G02855 [Canna indica]|uniref:Uncharacterized protein n=1 Tax=Canna indica TaxID=4628 RepID=A0AAQ3JRI9_9LILI|nr:hypothetical protein Cni_G02855 [Canna indica]
MRRPALVFASASTLLGCIGECVHRVCVTSLMGAPSEHELQRSCALKDTCLVQPLAASANERFSSTCAPTEIGSYIEIWRQLADDAVELVLLDVLALLRPLAKDHDGAALREDEGKQPPPKRVPSAAAPGRLRLWSVGLRGRYEVSPAAARRRRRTPGSKR